MQNELIPIREVLKRTGLSRAALYRQIHEGTFPSQVPIGKRSVRWPSGEVEAWIESRIDAARVAA